jgi:hypothetical protein
LGGAIQAYWVCRRDAGESVSADEVAAPLVERSSETATPNPAASAPYKEALERLEARTKTLFG